VKLKRKNNLTKEPKTNQKNKDHIEKKITCYRLRLKDKIENKLKFYKRVNNKT